MFRVYKCDFINQYLPVKFADDHTVLVLPLLVLATVEVENNYFCTLRLVIVLNVEVFFRGHTLDIESHFLNAVSAIKFDIMTTLQ